MPAVIEAAAQGATCDGEMMTSYYRDDLLGLPEMGMVARQLWGSLGPRAGGHLHCVPLRPLHALRSHAARGAGVLRTWRG